MRAIHPNTIHELARLSLGHHNAAYRYSPYSVMTVESVSLPSGGGHASAANPIRIVIVAALDNKPEPPDLPLAPWA